MKEVIKKMISVSSFAAKNKKTGLELILINEEEDYQIKFFSFLVINRKEEKFEPDLEIYKRENSELTEIFPIVKTDLETLEGESKIMFAFALPKSFNKDFVVRIKCKNNHSKKIDLHITQNH